MQKWLKDKKIPFDGKMKKTELYEIIKPGKKPVLHPACKITNLCPLLRGIFRAFEGLGGVH
jgi:hypothetical protein